MKKFLFLIVSLLVLIISGYNAHADEIDIIGIDHYEQMAIEVGTDPDTISFIDGLQLYDNTGEVLVQDKLLVDSSEVDFDRVGTYPITYYVLYLVNGMEERHIIHSIDIQITDTQSPILWGVSPIFVPQDTQNVNYLNGVHATDKDLDSLLTIYVDSSAVDLTTIGTYNLHYFVTDNSGNFTQISTKVVVTNQTTPDDLAPVLNNVPDHYSIQVNQDVTDYLSGITATDQDVDITSRLQYDDSNVNYQQIGSYYVYLFVFDTAGNLTRQVVPVEIVTDTEPPTFENLDDITVTVNTIVNLLTGIVALDDVCGDVSSRITIEYGTFDITRIGDYDVTFKVSDLNGNEALPQIVQVHVRDNVKPTITGNTNIFIKLGDSLDLFNQITITDNFDSDVQTDINVGSLNIHKEGAYVVTVTATDDSLNVATKQFIVNVYNNQTEAFYKNPIVIGSMVGIIASAFVTFSGILMNRRKR